MGRQKPKREDFRGLDSLLDTREFEVYNLNVTRVFLENLKSTKEINVNIGGGGSSKSYSIIQLLLYKFLTEPKKRILVTRKTKPSIRTSVLIPFYEIMEEMGVRSLIKEDKVNMNFEFNGSLIHFNGLDDPEKVKSSSWNYMWFEEATDITKDDFNTVRLYLRAKSLDKKPNQIFLTFNPIDEFHWIKSYIIDNPEFQNDIKVIHSTYKDNPFLDEASRRRYEDLINKDINYYRIYALGEWGKLENVIFNNWETVQVIPRDDRGYICVYGIDFGFNDPTTVVRCFVKDQNAYIEELLYRKGMTNSELIEFLHNNLSPREWKRPFYCDAAEPQRIKELRLAGFNVRPAVKNVLDGIDFLKRMRIYISQNSPWLIKEFRSYSWRTDRRGRIIDEPIDFLNHGIDAVRYAIYTHFRREGGSYKVRWI